jgi:hypothetical protein
VPVSAYFKGHGSAVLADMIRRHGKKRGKEIFYATANKRGMTPDDRKKALKRKAGR